MTQCLSISKHHDMQVRTICSLYVINTEHTGLGNQKLRLQSPALPASSLRLPVGSPDHLCLSPSYTMRIKRGPCAAERALHVKFCQLPVVTSPPSDSEGRAARIFQI